MELVILPRPREIWPPSLSASREGSVALRPAVALTAAGAHVIVHVLVALAGVADGVLDEIRATFWKTRRLRGTQLITETEKCGVLC